MLTLKGSDQLRTMRNVKSFRSAPASTGLPGWGAELGRICQEEVARCQRELQRRWLGAAWRQRCQCWRRGIGQGLPRGRQGSPW